MISIIIPTYNHCDDFLKPCIESIIKYTDLNGIEVLISANGCTDNTKEYVESLGEPFKLIWNEKPIGYSRANNVAIEQSKGEYIVLLNNDTVLLEQKINTWLDMLIKPFVDSSVGITGPLKGPSEPAGRDFIIFFCCMIKKEVFDKIGLLDTDFGVGGGEDTDFCIRAENAGYKLVQVPERSLMNGGKFMIGVFPIYHKGEGTMHDTNCVKDWDKTFNTNSDILRQKYNNELTVKLNLGCGALKKDGYINIDLYDDTADMNLDVRQLSPEFSDCSVHEIFASHIIEHFSPYEIIKILKEWYRVLKIGGKLILELPDIEACCKEYGGSDRKKKYEILTCIYGALPDVKVPHLYGWDFELLCDHLYPVGFKRIVKKPTEGWHAGCNMRVEAYR